MSEPAKKNRGRPPAVMPSSAPLISISAAPLLSFGEGDSISSAAVTELQSEVDALAQLAAALVTGDKKRGRPAKRSDVA